ncbi:MAG: universal stress protein [Candidatus Dormiibacterota bacterium]
MTEGTQARAAAAVVVGVDGSDGAKEALRWALAEARLRKAPLRIVHAWTYASMGATTGGYGYLGGFDSSSALGVENNDLQRAAEELVDRLIGEVVGDVKDVEVERQVIEGRSAEVLVGAVAASDLLVVGSRGHWGFAGLLLGSVSQECVHHAPCPVVVVHPAQTSARDQEVAHEPPGHAARV